MSVADILIGAGVALILFIAARTAWTKKGTCSCGCNGKCPGCNKNK